MSYGTTHPLQAANSRRKMLGVTAKAAASALNILVSSYYRLERGERVCPLPKAITLAHLLSCTVEQLGQEPTMEEQLAAAHTRIQRSASGLPAETASDLSEDAIQWLAGTGGTMTEEDDEDSPQ